MALFKKEHEAAFKELPRHIGIIMDGNGRWAKKRGLPRTAGHRKGADAFEKICRECNRLKIKEVTFYAFSTENWNRPKSEVQALMQLFHDFLIEAKTRLSETENIRVRFIGDRGVLDSGLIKLMDEAEADTAQRTGTLVNIAINYGGRQEIVYAVNKLIAAGRQNVTENDISENIYTSPDCDLIIRPSGEKRLSNFMLWQAAYSEFQYSRVLWPDFDEHDLHRALHEFENRNRRFGK
ncbi:MAG: di-trans,poly-cis-decaprenylcistransferase [Clostridiales bacterium]|nr:di-trans,poly-cis-decaprenylcistransferase [Clostridiales bacterium]